MGGKNDDSLYYDREEKTKTKFPAIPGPAIIRPKRDPGKFLEQLEFELILIRET